MDTAMIASMTQRSHNLGATNINSEGAESRLASQRKPQTARCGSTANGAGFFPDRSYIHGINLANGVRQQRDIRGLLEFLND